MSRLLVGLEGISIYVELIEDASMWLVSDGVAAVVERFGFACLDPLERSGRQRVELRCRCFLEIEPNDKSEHGAPFVDGRA